MKKKEVVKAYRKIAKKLDKLQVDACLHISRKDNNQIFEISYFLQDVAKRIEDEYSQSEYPRLIK